jgi:hypothetical protein
MTRGSETQRFLCNECRRYFAIELMYTREEKSYCPSCFRYEYGWEDNELDGFAVCSSSGFLWPGSE